MKGQLRLLGSLLLIGNSWEVCFQSRSRANILLHLYCYLFLTNKNESSWMSFLFQRWSCEGSHCISTDTNKWSFCLHQTSIYCSTSFEKITLVWLFFHSHLAWVLGRLDILHRWWYRHWKVWKTCMFLSEQFCFPFCSRSVAIDCFTSFIYSV